jgi:hypothetical protein
MRIYDANDSSLRTATAPGQQLSLDSTKADGIVLAHNRPQDYGGGGGGRGSGGGLSGKGGGRNGSGGDGRGLTSWDRWTKSVKDFLDGIWEHLTSPPRSSDPTPKDPPSRDNDTRGHDDSFNETTTWNDGDGSNFSNVV